MTTKRTLLLLVASAFTFAGFSQTATEPKKNGKETLKYDNGNTQAEGRVHKHQRTGLWSFYDEDGHLEKTMTYYDGELNGEYVGYLSDNVPYVKGSYLYGKKNGEWTNYYSSGKVASVANYRYGALSGLQQSYYSSGQLKEQSEYVSDQKTYLWSYYSNGHLKACESYIDGKQSGIWRTYPDPAVAKDTFPLTVDSYVYGNPDGLHQKYYNGHLLEEWTYHNGKYEGKNNLWDSTGNIIRQETWVDGHKDGKCIYYYQGRLLTEENWADGQPVGAQIRNDSAGHPFVREYFSDGGLDSSYRYFANGKVKEKKILAKSDKAPRVSSHNSHVVVDASTTAPMKNLDYWEYDSTGAIVTKGKYHGKYQNGLWTTYYPGGKLESSIVYKDGEVDSTAKFYYPNGKLKLSIVVEDNEVVQQPLAYDKNGVAIKKDADAYYDLLDETIPSFIDNDESNYRAPVSATSSHTVAVVDNIAHTQTSSHNVSSDRFGSEKGDGNSSSSNVNSSSDNSDVFTYAEEMPEYPGGTTALNSYLSSHIKYPYGSTGSGTVYVKFVVEKDGSVTGAEIMKSAPGHPEFDKEALRVISSLPNWTPGKQNGRTVRVSMIQPVRFTSQ
ncbi:MAG TPA: TonB family protein [Bacteroidia bacterium]|nr:TonB family protein [Bacteroidia bacterium]